MQLSLKSVVALKLIKPKQTPVCWESVCQLSKQNICQPTLGWDLQSSKYRSAISGTIIAQSVNKDGRGAVHPILDAAAKVPPDFVTIHVIAHLAIESLKIQAD